MLKAPCIVYVVFLWADVALEWSRLGFTLQAQTADSTNPAAIRLILFQSSGFSMFLQMWGRRVGRLAPEDSPTGVSL